MRRVFLFLSILVGGTLFCSAHFSCASGPTIVADDTHFTKPTEWKKSESPYHVMGQIFVDSGGELTIEPGVVVKFEYQYGKLNAFGEFTAVGREKDPIVFTSIRDDAFGGDSNGDGDATAPAGGDWQDVNLSGSKEIKIKYAKVMYGGGYRADDAIVINSNDNVSVTRSEIKNNRYAGFKIVNSLPTIEENIITNNWYGVYSPDSKKTLVLKNNSIYANRYFGATARNIWSGILCGHIDARNNWWGDGSGPKHASNPDGTGDKISDNILFDPWLDKDPHDDGPDPAIIIPGIMGSWEKDGIWQIDPIFHTYDNLIEAFIAAGYKNDGKEMSVFPYQWRDSNVENAKLLHKRIQKIKEDTGRPKVDIVAHSMGGLLAREYIESDYYADDVDQLITIGTPHLGAPKDYIKWEAGAFFSDIFELAGKKFFEHEAKENGYDSAFHYIRGRPMESVRELLPVYDYLYDDNGSDYDLRTGYPENYPRNEFLENLNDADRIKALEGVEFTNIIGKQIGQTTTTSGFNVIDADMGELWKHGYPHGFEIPVIGDQGLRKSEGDRTVPLYSSEGNNNLSNQVIYLKSNHNDLPTDAQKDILEILTQKRPGGEINEWTIDDILIGLVFSPVDIQIISPSGKRLGKNFDTGDEFNEIEGAYYSGSGADTEFFTIPDPEDEGEYKIIAQGTGNGEYEIETTRIIEKNPEISEESTATIKGIIEDGDIREAEIGIEEDGLVKKSVTIDTIREDVDYYFKLGLIKKKVAKNYLAIQLKHLENLFELLEKAKNSRLKPIPKQAAVRALEKIINADVDQLVRWIKRKSPEWIDEKAAELLIESFNELKIN